MKNWKSLIIGVSLLLLWLWILPTVAVTYFGWSNFYAVSLGMFSGFFNLVFCLVLLDY